jgi:alpha-beta hydrolase superfamily lysophospholipase
MLQNASKIGKPTLVLHGDADIIALPKSATQVMEHLKTQDKQLQTFAGADHWFFHSLIPTATSKYSDEQRRTVSKVIKEWLNAR